MADIKKYIPDPPKPWPPFVRTEVARLIQNKEFSYPMRGSISMLAVYYLVSLHQPKHILEIGFFEGQTFGALLEAAPIGATLTAVDVEFNTEVFDRTYRIPEYVGNKTVKFIKSASCDMPDPDVKYGFVNIDGGRNRFEDLMRVVTWMEPTGIIMLDNFRQLDDQVIHFMELEDEHQFVPFLTDGQAMYFRHRKTDQSALIKNLEYWLGKHLDMSALDYYGYIVKQLVDKPREILDDFEFLMMYCRKVRI